VIDHRFLQTGALFAGERRFPDVGITVAACKRFFESCETFEDRRYRAVTPRKRSSGPLSASNAALAL
jgi:hypothetical protein